MTTPPQVKGLPLLGNTIAFWRNPVDFFRQGYETHGPVFSFRIASKPAVALIGPEHQQFFFQATDDVFSMQEAYRFVGVLFGESMMFLADDKEHQEQRAVYHPAFQGRRLHGYVAAMVREVEEWLDTLGNRGEIELTATFRQLAANVASRALMGDHFRRQLGPQFGQLFKQLMEGIDYVLPQNLPLPRFRRRERAKVGLHAIMGRIIAERRASREEHDDFLQTLVDARYSDGRPFPDELIANLIMGLIWSGYETTSGTLGWSLLLVLQHPEVLARLRDEQESVLDPDQPLDMETISRMRVLEMTVRETERFCPVVPLVVRYPVRDYEVGGYHVPRGWVTFLCPPVAHRLPEVFPNPHVYDPERFARDKYPPFSLIGFGGAHHRCLGYNFANYEVKIVLASLLRRYDVTLLTADPKPLTRPGTVRGPEPPCFVRYQRRAPVVRKVAAHAAAAEAATAGRCPFHP